MVTQEAYVNAKPTVSAQLAAHFITQAIVRDPRIAQLTRAYKSDLEHREKGKSILAMRVDDSKKPITSLNPDLVVKLSIANVGESRTPESDFRAAIATLRNNGDGIEVQMKSQDSQKAPYGRLEDGITEILEATGLKSKMSVYDTRKAVIGTVSMAKTKASILTFEKREDDQTTRVVVTITAELEPSSSTNKLLTSAEVGLTATIRFAVQVYELPRQ